MGEQVNEQEQWKASWIWGSGEESPRNEWRCFRKEVRLPVEEEAGRVFLRLTADSRYVLYVNGVQAGRGPVRSWPFALAYDEYEIGHLLRPGTVNVIAVLVLHFGVSNFYYLRGRGGLLAQLEAERAGEREALAATDATWKTAVHAGHDPFSSRMSCQHAFVEITDARLWDEAWTGVGYDDAAWEDASVLGAVGMEPWPGLMARDIPHLTEETVYPARVEALRRVTPVSWAAALDLRNHFDPDSANHANNVEFSGLLLTIVRMLEAGTLTIGFVDDGRLRGLCAVDGEWFEAERFRKADPERYIDVRLEAGDHLLAIDVSGTNHGHSYHLALDAAGTPFEVVSPLAATASGSDMALPQAETPFVTLGPFALRTIIDHAPERPIDMNHPELARARAIGSADELKAFASWLQPVARRYVSLTDLFSLSVWKRQEAALPVPLALQQAVIASQDAAIVPLFDGEDTELTIDFGRMLSGYLAFEVEASEGTILDFYGYEHMWEGWRQDTHQLDNTLRYVCRGGRQTYVSPIRRGLRYVMLTVRHAATPMKLFKLTMGQSNYPVADIGRFQCSDALLNEIWRISHHTTRVCMEDTFVDCPAYEQVFWVGDARNEALVGYYSFGDARIVERCLRLVPGSRFQTPLYADQVPSGWSSVIPNWTFFWAIACIELYEYEGSETFAADMWPHLSFTLDHYLEKLDARGLFSIEAWNLLDWAPIDQPRSGVVAHQNMFFVKALRAASGLAAGRDADAARRYAAAAEDLRAAINAHLWSEERQAYRDCIHADGRLSEVFSMQTQVVAYLCDIPEGATLRQIESYVQSPPDDFVQIGSPFMSFFYYEALAKLNRIDLLLADARVQYGQMLDYDASTCWEMYPKPLADGSGPDPKRLTRSHCHAWSAGPAYFFGAHVLGVQGADPGWRTVRIRPQPSGLAWARGAVPHPGGGRIDVAWGYEPDGTTLRLRVAAPVGVELLTEPPAGVKMTVERSVIG